MLDLTPFYLVPPLVALLLRLPSHRVPIENNAATYLYDTVFGTREVPAVGLEATVGILQLGHRLFGNRWDYRWVRGVYTLFAMWAVVVVSLLGRELGGDAAGLAAGMCLAVFAHMPQLVPWFTNSERANIASMGSAYLLCLWGARLGSPVLMGVAGLAAGLSVSCKVPSVSEVLPLVWFAWLPAASSSPAVRLAPLLVGLAVVPIGGYVWHGRKYGYDLLLGTPALLLRYKGADQRLREQTEVVQQRSLLATRLGEVVRATLPLWILGPAFVAWKAWQGGDPRAMLLGAWLLLAFLGMAAQRVFSYGHWVPLLPPLCALSGATLGVAFSEGHELFACVGVLVLLLGLAIGLRDGLAHPWRIKVKLPFQRMFLDLARELAAATRPEDTIFAWGWHPQVYVLSGKRSAVEGLLYCKPGYVERMAPDWKRRLVRGFLLHRPRYIALLEFGFPIEMVTELTGLRYGLDPTRKSPLRFTVLRLADEDVAAPGAPSGPGEDALDGALRQAETRAADAEAKGDLFAAERPMRRLIEYDSARYRPLFAQRLARVNPAWEVCAPGSLLADLPGEYVVEPARNGQKTCAVRTEAGVAPLHSRYEPDVEARRLVEAAGDLAAAKRVVMLGLGLGYLLAELAARMAADSRIVVVERRRQALEAFRGMEWAPRLLADPRVTVFVSVQPSVVRAWLQSACAEAILAQHPPSVTLDEAYYSEVCAGILKV